MPLLMPKLWYSALQEKCKDCSGVDVSTQTVSTFLEWYVCVSPETRNRRHWSTSVSLMVSSSVQEVSIRLGVLRYGGGTYDTSCGQWWFLVHFCWLLSYTTLKLERGEKKMSKAGDDFQHRPRESKKPGLTWCRWCMCISHVFHVPSATERYKHIHDARAAFNVTLGNIATLCQWIEGWFIPLLYLLLAFRNHHTFWTASPVWATNFLDWELAWCFCAVQH